MRAVLFAFCCLLLCAPPATAKVSKELARHLLERSGFTPSPAELSAAMAADSYRSLVNDIVQSARQAPAASVAVPSLQTARDVRPGQLTPAARKAHRRGMRTDMHALRTFWVESMLATRTPLRERMTLFWHNHFVSSAQKVRSPHAMLDQHMRFRTHAVGNFGALLRAMMQDPALLFYLDNQRNHRRAPNENFARELLELFTMGEGHYTERDIKEAARALTGASVEPGSKTYRFRPRQHDDGDKTILGRTGPFDGADLAEVILAQERTAVFVVEKLWRAFVSPAPAPRAVRDIARQFRQADYDIAVALRALFMHPAFAVEAGRGSLVKSPVDIVVGTERVMPRGLRPEQAVRALHQMGQTLFAPPNVKGWPGHTTWVTTASLDRRRTFLRQAWKDRLVVQSRESLTPRVVLATAAAGPIEDGAALEKQLHQALLDPAYQVK